MASRSRTRHVGILIETDDSWGRNVVEAICRFGRSQGWAVLISPRDRQGRLRLPSVWGGDGVIASLRTRASIQHVQKRKLPVVDVSIMMPKSEWLGRVATDDQARAEMAFGHLRDRGLSDFACYAPPIGRYSDVRAEAFVSVVESAGFTCSRYDPRTEEACGWLSNYSQARRWLSSLPRPIGVFAADPYPARQLVEICELESIRVPDELAILSGDDDDLLCNVASPHISAVELASQQIGETAGRMLTRIMNGGSVPAQTTLIPPLRVRARQSTDILAMGDDELAEILRYIRDHAQQGLAVGELVERFAISRRRLEQRFRNELHRTPAEEIRRVRMAAVSRKLLDTSMPVVTIAADCGFASAASLSQAFRQHFGATPGEYRIRNRNA